MPLPEKNISRISFFDNWRGVAFLTMFVFHFFAIFEYGGVFNVGLYNNSDTGLVLFLQLLGSFTRYSFIIISAIVSVYSFRKCLLKTDWLRASLQVWKRASQVLLVALLINLFSFLLIPEAPVYFGILHYLSFMMILLPFFAFNRGILVVSLGLAIVGRIWGLGAEVNFPIWLKIVLGFKVYFTSLDYFAILRWLPVTIVGWLLSPALVELGANLKFNSKILAWLGRRTLTLYWLHIVVLILFVGLYRIL